MTSPDTPDPPQEPSSHAAVTENETSGNVQLYRNTHSGEPITSNRPQIVEVAKKPVQTEPTVRSKTSYHKNRLAPFEHAIITVRWATTAVSLLLIANADRPIQLLETIWIALIFCNTAARTVKPLRYEGYRSQTIQLALEVALHVVAVASTGFWESPLVFPLVTGIILAGFARGFTFALEVSILSAIGITMPAIVSVQAADADLTNRSLKWITVLILTAVTAGYGRFINSEPSVEADQSVKRLAQLSDANELLADLHRVAQTLPASLDHGEVLQSSISRLRTLFHFDSVVIFTIDETDSRWMVVHQEGIPVPNNIVSDELPSAALEAATHRKLIRVDRSETNNQLLADGQSAMYAPLLARKKLVGLLAVESREKNAFTSENEQALGGFVEPVGLAIDNARWFSRLKTVSANEERTRIARDLHDRLGQSLAYLGFEIDRITRRNTNGEEIGDSLLDLRTDLKALIGQVRDTLYDLRTDVAEKKDFTDTVEEFANRIAERANLSITITSDTHARLPILQEREMWRITQEALINVERHADATEVNVFWYCSEDTAIAEVADNGRGLQRDEPGRLDSYGILGMRERATSIGASLELISKPGEGTQVRCYLERR